MTIIVILVTLVVNCWCIADGDSNFNGCVLPKHPTNGKWLISGDVKLLPGENAKSGSVLSISCNSQHKPIGSSNITCHNGVWSSEIGQCSELCPPLIEKSSITFTCLTNGTETDCSTPINGTKAILKCAPFYENEEINRNPFRVCKNGKWDDVIFPCSPICGIKPEASENSTRKPFYPWNVIIYTIKNNTKHAACVGTLINENAIVTIASCVSEEIVVNNTVNIVVQPPLQFSLAAGKSFEEYEDSRDPEAQYSDVKDIFIPDSYKGVLGKFHANIAVIIARTNFNMSKRVQPACIDLSNKYKNEYEFPKMNGKIAGPIIPMIFPNFTEIVEMEIPMMSEHECFRTLSQSYRDHNFGRPIPYHYIYSITDRYCAQYTNSEGFIDCIMDVGVGLITKNSFTKKYYVTGVFSGGTINTEIEWFKCDKGAWMLFTKISDYVDFITEKLNMYISINPDQHPASCGINSVQTQNLIVDSNNVEKEVEPWQVALYRTRDSTKSLICTGSLINPRLILTAAHCVADNEGKKLSEDNFIVAVGKYFMNFDDAIDKKAQFSAVKEIVLPNSFPDILQNYAGDIAILITESAFELSRDIQPICMDWRAKYESQFLKPDTSGFVSTAELIYNNAFWNVPISPWLYIIVIMLLWKL